MTVEKVIVGCYSNIAMKVFSSRVYCDAGEDDRHEKDVVRGYTFAEYHADVYDKTESEVTGAGLDCECLGGGRIEHRPGDKYIKVARINLFSQV